MSSGLSLDWSLEIVQFENKIFRGNLGKEEAKIGEKKFALCVDFGTLSGRAVIVDVANGTEIATAVHDYANGVINDNLPGTEIHLEPDWALQDPNDYIEVFKNSIPTMLVGDFSSESRKTWQEIQRFLQVHFQGIPVP